MNAKQLYAFEAGGHPSNLVCCMRDDGDLSDDALLSDIFSEESCAPHVIEVHSSLAACTSAADRISKKIPFIEFVSGKTDALDSVVSQLRCCDFEVEGVSTGCSGGVYFFKVPAGQKLAVFKPHDEEPNAPNNPNSHKNVFGTIGLKRGILSGESSFREFAAFLLDHQGVAHVPDTCLVRCWHPAFASSEPKEGSLQLFRSHRHSLEDYGDFSHIDVSDLQFMAVLDIRLCNVDRNVGNILVNYDTPDHKWHVTAIDHGYCLPDFSGLCDVEFGWARWTQARAPVQERVKAYIASLSADDDLDLLMRRVPEICALRRAECLLSIRISTMLLKMCIAADKTLAFVADLFRAPLPFHTFGNNSRGSPRFIFIILFSSLSNRSCRCQPEWSPVKLLIEKAVTQAKIKCDMQVLHRSAPPICAAHRARVNPNQRLAFAARNSIDPRRKPKPTS
jgi:hypothetical protein